VVTVRSAVLEVKDKVVRFAHEMMNRALTLPMTTKAHDEV
jgi:hypothetical protein